MQQYELEAWLGDDHGLDEQQLDELLAEANEIDERYPDPDDQAERDAALVTAYRLKLEPAETVVAEYGQQLTAARAAVAVASAGLQQAAQSTIANGDFTEAGFARAGGIDRMTVRKWTQDQRDRALLDRALFELVRSHGMPAEDQDKLSEAINIRDTSSQATTLLAALSTHSIDYLSEEGRELVARAEKRARQIV
ncbi:hypothetical protein ACIPMW_00060 [Streptomyces sp. NPDC086669]|uniref:hypothetical protein n=1 Tax=Streptomyces sp. NPDC086669 TaxID=3365753 RepID=UPI003803C09E